VLPQAATARRHRGRAHACSGLPGCTSSCSIPMGAAGPSAR